jgi:hypothetical protein
MIVNLREDDDHFLNLNTSSSNWILKGMLFINLF